MIVGRSGTTEPPAQRRGGTASGRPGAQSQGVLGFLREAAIVVVAALVISLVIKTFFAQAFYIPSESMEDTLKVDDRLIVNKLRPGPLDIQRGDVVVFVDPGGWLRPHYEEPTVVQQVLTWVGLLPADAGEHLIKRVIGLPGDEVACCDDQGRVTVNGAPLDEPYIKPGAVPSEKTFDETVPAEHLWVMGDNRPRSQDSRYSQGAVGGGFVPIDNVVGTAWVRVWPLDRLGMIGRSGETFADVPDPGTREPAPDQETAGD
ncbi:signal peptidase I [Pseudactinotalea sp. HY158]|nr:signal peptidase I [Pseudactinotalea sp. HY158]QGH69905.1 signal peptidase I [Pseudactinotalea sp. HY158]